MKKILHYVILLCSAFAVLVSIKALLSISERERGEWGKLHEAEALCSRGEYEEAVHLLTEYLDVYPNHMRARDCLRMARKEMKERRNREAIMDDAAFLEFLSSWPKAVDLQQELPNPTGKPNVDRHLSKQSLFAGLGAAHEKRYETAGTHCVTAIRLNTLNYDAYGLASMLLLHVLDRPADAEVLLRKEMELLSPVETTDASNRVDKIRKELKIVGRRRDELGRHQSLQSQSETDLLLKTRVENTPAAKDKSFADKINTPARREN